MKTIRDNTFETNSSSTHSVTIRTKSSCDEAKLLVDDQGRLVPWNLGSHTTCVEETYITICETKDKKAAILVDWLTYRLVTEELAKETVAKAIEILVEKCGYTGIDRSHGETAYNFRSSADYVGESDDEYLEDLKSDDFESFEKYINLVVLNDTKEIVDMDVPS